MVVMMDLMKSIEVIVGCRVEVVEVVDEWMWKEDGVVGGAII